MDAAFRELQPFLNEKGQLTALPAKNKKKLLAIWYLAAKPEPGREYTESAINDALDDWMTFRDHATLRRELYNKRLLDRTDDGARYWRADTLPEPAQFVADHT